MEKKYVGIVYNFYGDNNLIGKVIIENFEKTKKWFKDWAEGSNSEDEFSEENTNVNISWEVDNDLDSYKICIVDDWNNVEQVSKFRNVLKKWSWMAGESWQERDWDIADCLSFEVYNKDGMLYDISEDSDIIHKEDGKYEHDLYSDKESDIEGYLFKKIDGLVKKEVGTTKKEVGTTKKEVGTTKKEVGTTKKEDPIKEAPVETEKDFIDAIADKLLAKAMDKVYDKIGNGEDLFDDAVVSSIVDKLFEKVSDQLNKKLGL